MAMENGEEGEDSEIKNGGERERGGLNDLQLRNQQQNSA